MRNILVTGGAGFIGSNYIKNDAVSSNHNLICLDALTYAGNLYNLIDVKDKITFIRGDICDEKLINSIFEEYDIDTVINFAAESHVDRSIIEPHIFVKTNIMGVQTLLKSCRDNWCVNPTEKNCMDYKKGVKYLQISTDEVYGTLGKTGKFTEKTPIGPNSPYSSSKASADLFVRAYYKTFGLPTLITRCSNNYGPNQYPEKLIPLTIMNALSNKKIPIYGQGNQIRDWIFVKDHCLAIKSVLEKGSSGEVYNIGCENEWTNLSIVEFILKELDRNPNLIEHVTDRPGHDIRYAIDNTKIKSNLGWEPKYQFEKGIKETINWYVENNEWIEKINNGSYRKLTRF